MQTAALRRLLPVMIALTLLTPGRSAAAPQPPGPSLGNGNSVEFADNTRLRACGANKDGDNLSTFGSYQSLQSCTFVTDQPGRALVIATASLGLADVTDHYEAAFRVDHNTGVTGDPVTERTVDVYPDSALQTNGDGTDRNVAITAMYTLTAGAHTFDFMWKRNESSDVNVEMEAIDASIAVLFLPPGLDLLSCGDQPGGSYPNNTAGTIPTAHCALTVPGPGVVFVSADGWLRLDAPSDPPYEAANQLVMTGPSSESQSIRYTDVYTSASTPGTISNDGIDVAVANTAVFSVTTPGTYTFTHTLRRQSGTSTVRMQNATLAALYVPDHSPYANVCAERGGALIDLDGDNHAAVVSCQLDAPADTWAFISSTSSVGLNDALQPYEGVFSLGLDGLFPENPTSRYVNSYPNSGDGLDASMADALLLPVTQGPHTFNLLAKRQSGDPAAEVRMRFPVLFVLVPGASTFMPLSVGP